MTPPSMSRSLPVMKLASGPSRNAAADATSSVVPTRPAADVSIIRWYPALPGPLISSCASGVRTMPGLMELTRAPRSPQRTLAACTRR